MGKAKPRSSLESTKPSEKWPKAKPTEATARSQHFDKTQFSNRLLISGLHALTHVSYEISSFDRFSRICTALRFAILPAESSLRAVASLLFIKPLVLTTRFTFRDTDFTAPRVFYQAPTPRHENPTLLQKERCVSMAVCMLEADPGPRVSGIFLLIEWLNSPASNTNDRAS